VSYQVEQIFGDLFRGCWLIVSLVTLILTLLHQTAQARALAACSPRHRTLEPGLVWLNFMPVFHLFWKFWTAAQVGNSVRQEFRARGMRTDQAFGKTAGAIGPTVAVVSRGVLALGFLIAMLLRDGDVFFLAVVLVTLLAPVEVVFLLVHWTQVSTLTRQLNAGRPATGTANWEYDETGPERDFDEDYRPIPRRRRREG
jgi:hypothetical protein